MSWEPHPVSAAALRAGAEGGGGGGRERARPRCTGLAAGANSQFPLIMVRRAGPSRAHMPTHGRWVCSAIQSARIIHLLLILLIVGSSFLSSLSGGFLSLLHHPFVFTSYALLPVCSSGLLMWVCLWFQIRAPQTSDYTPLRLAQSTKSNQIIQINTNLPPSIHHGPDMQTSI